jgi:hypothetical protein
MSEERQKGAWITDDLKRRADDLAARIVADGVPEDAFSNATEYSSIQWECWFPGHCYICHVANVPDDSEEDDTTACGPHCGS